LNTAQAAPYPALVKSYCKVLVPAVASAIE
jgi:hypothetical protein